MTPVAIGDTQGTQEALKPCKRLNTVYTTSIESTLKCKKVSLHSLIYFPADTWPESVTSSAEGDDE